MVTIGHKYKIIINKIMYVLKNGIKNNNVTFLFFSKIIKFLIRFILRFNNALFIYKLSRVYKIFYRYCSPNIQSRYRMQCVCTLITIRCYTGQQTEIMAVPHHP